MDRVTFETTMKEEFNEKARVHKKNMTTVLNDWIEAYLKDDFYTKKDMVVIFSTVLLNVGLADRVPEAEQLIDEALEDSFEQLSLTRKVLTGGLKMPAGILLRDLRKEKRLTLRAAADAVGGILGKNYPWQNIARLESQPGNPRQATIEPVLKVYGYTYDEFLERLDKGV